MAPSIDQCAVMTFTPQRIRGFCRSTAFMRVVSDNMKLIQRKDKEFGVNLLNKFFGATDVYIPGAKEHADEIEREAERLERDLLDAFTINATAACKAWSYMEQDREGYKGRFENLLLLNINGNNNAAKRAIYVGRGVIAMKLACDIFIAVGGGLAKSAVKAAAVGIGYGAGTAGASYAGELSTSGETGVAVALALGVNGAGNAASEMLAADAQNALGVAAQDARLADKFRQTAEALKAEQAARRAMSNAALAAFERDLQAGKIPTHLLSREIIKAELAEDMLNNQSAKNLMGGMKVAKAAEYLGKGLIVMSVAIGAKEAYDNWNKLGSMD